MVLSNSGHRLLLCAIHVTTSVQVIAKAKEFEENDSDNDTMKCIWMTMVMIMRVVKMMQGL